MDEVTLIRFVWMIVGGYGVAAWAYCIYLLTRYDGYNLHGWSSAFRYADIFTLLVTIYLTLVMFQSLYIADLAPSAEEIRRLIAWAMAYLLAYFPTRAMVSAISAKRFLHRTQAG